ncbi:MAG TPA: hypothetical protein VH189_15925 [Rhizomicrobium sp.]|nr:hypothetical protein [Rhizomicrobium sp.]
MRILIAATAVMLAASSASAQEAAQPGPQNQAVKGIHQNNSGTPVQGANSFTRAEAEKQIEAKGYTHIAGLNQDKHGVWRATAEKNGATGPVSLDYQGNVN